MNKKYILGIDCGTQSTKVVVFDLAGKVITSAKKAISLERARANWAEQNAEEWWSSLCDVLQSVTNKIDKNKILGLAIAYQRETFVPVDSKFHPLRKAFLWMDQRATREAEEVRNVISENKFTNITGKFLNPTPSIMKIKWIKNNEPDIWGRIDKIMTVGAYINYQLTDRVIDAAAGVDTTGLFDINTGKWSDELLDVGGLRKSQLFDVLPSGSKVGDITKMAAEKTGLFEGTPVFLAGGDGQVFAVGVGAIKESEMAISIGTSGTCDIHGSKINLKSGSRALASCIEGLYVHESVLMSAANNVSWFIRNFESVSQDRKKGSPESELDQAIGNIPPCSDGLITIPYLRGSMMPYNDPNTRGATLGWSDIHTKLHFYKSILEGIAFEIRLIIDNYEKNTGVKVSSITIGGGGAASNKWLNIIADIVGKNIHISDTNENTALGAAIMAACGLNIYKNVDLAVKEMCRTRNTFIPDDDRLLLYNKFFNEVYKEVYPAIRKYLKYLGSFDINTNK